MGSSRGRTQDTGTGTGPSPPVFLAVAMVGAWVKARSKGQQKRQPVTPVVHVVEGGWVRGQKRTRVGFIFLTFF
jgi:hypothetical protein